MYLSRESFDADAAGLSRTPVQGTPREMMASRLPAAVQPLLTWITAMPAPGEVRADRPAWAYVAGALGLVLGGCALGAVPLALAAPPAWAWLLLPLGLLLTSSGLGLFQVVIFHHCSHGTVFANRERNRQAGRMVSAFLLFKRFEDYQREHMMHHSAKKLLTEEDEFADFVLGMCRLEPGLPKAELWRRVAINTVSPVFHASFLRRRIQAALFSGDRGHDWMGRLFWGGLFALALATGTLVELLILWVLPVTVLLQIATIYRILCEHRFPDAEFIALRDRNFVCESTTGVFAGRPPPERAATTLVGFAQWAAWWADLLTVQLFVRLFVLVGDAPCHDFHHRRPATRRWTNYIHARQQDAEAGSPGFPRGYTDCWGLFEAVDSNLATLAATSPASIGR
jgi:fatty acid desaturase